MTGYVKVITTTIHGDIIRFHGEDEIQYESGGTFSVYLSDALPGIQEYNQTLITQTPQVSIGGEEATFAVQNAADAARSDAINVGLTLIVIAVSVIAIRPVLVEFVTKKFN